MIRLSDPLWIQTAVFSVLILGAEILRAVGDNDGGRPGCAAVGASPQKDAAWIVAVGAANTSLAGGEDGARLRDDRSELMIGGYFGVIAVPDDRH